MESKDHTGYYFDHIMRVTDIDFNNILSEEKTFGKVFLKRFSLSHFIQNFYG